MYGTLSIPNEFNHLITIGVIGMVVMGLLPRVWEVEVSGLNPTMESIWEITSCSRLILTSILDGARCVMAHLDPLLLQIRAQRVECNYSHDVQVGKETKHLNPTNFLSSFSL